MRLKLLFIVGLGAGYILGARAGRPRYEQIRAKAAEAWEDPRVQKAVTETQDFVKENAPIIQEKVIAGTKAAVAGVQDAAVHATDIVKDVSGKVAEVTKDVSERVVETTKDVSGKVAETAKDVSGKVAETSKTVSESVVKSTKDASKRAKKASRKVAKTAKEASSTVSKTAKEVRDRIIDRGDEVVEGVIIAAGTARDDALDIDTEIDSDDGK